MILFSIGEETEFDSDDPFCRAIWAMDREAAIDLFRKEWANEYGDPLPEVDFTKLNIEDCSAKGFTNDGVGEPKVEHDMKILHAIGWCIEGQSRCEVCELYFDSIHHNCGCCVDCCDCEFDGDCDDDDNEEAS